MILLVDKIEKSFGARVLFSGASFQINPGERFALVGPNGAGKTTMLKIIMGIDSPDAGQIQYAKDCQVGYLEQETNLEHKDTTILAEVMAAAKEIRRMGERANELQAQITELSEQGKDVDALLNEYGQVQDRFEHLGGYELESNARKILSGLGFKVTDFERPCSEFSGGWQMRIALAKLFLRHPDLLLLDEPTNHLDLESVQWLYRQLRRRRTHRQPRPRLHGRLRRPRGRTREPSRDHLHRQLQQLPQAARGQPGADARQARRPGARHRPHAGLRR